MRIRPSPALVSLCALAIACNAGHGNGQTATAAGSVSSQASPTTAGGLPRGYLGRTDNPAKSISGVTYTAAAGGMWEVSSGTHDQNLSHIMYSPADTARGMFTVTTEIDQISPPMHDEAAGVFIGGRDLAGPDQTYAYFLVRGDGQYSIKLRRGNAATILVPFTRSPNVPKADTSGHVSYPLQVRVDKDSIRMLVNGQPVAAIARDTIPTDGIVGLRVNHGLHLMVKPLAISS